MACRGVHFAIPQPDAERLLTGPDDHAVISIVQDEIEERWDEDWLYQTDKAWDAIHRCLTDGTLDPNGGSYPLRLAVLNGRHLHTGENYIVSLVRPEEVRDVANELRKIDQQWMKNRYDSLDSNLYDGPKTNEGWEYTWEYFSGLAAFFQKAAEANRFVLFSVDQ
jgi:hypothetical protein